MLRCAERSGSGGGRKLAVVAIVGALLATVAGCASITGPRSHHGLAQTSAATATPAKQPAPLPTCTEVSTAAAAWPATPVSPSPTTATTTSGEPTPTEAHPAFGGSATEPSAPNDTASTPPDLIAAPPKAPSKTSDLAFSTGAAPALTYAGLDGATCSAELKKRGIQVTPAGPTEGVDQPVRLQSKLHGVDFHGQEPAAQRATSPWEIVDCRLVLALDDFSRILAAHDVVEAVHMSIYRPPPKKSKETKHARHEAALAIDLGWVIKKDGTKLVVLDHWHGHIGAKTCGDGAGPSPATKEALELRSILCDAADAKLFNVVLTPDYNKPHQNHFHLEVTRGVKWFIVN